MAPVLKVNSFEELNHSLRNACQQNVNRHVRGEDAPVSELWEEEKGLLLPLPAADYAACITHLVKPNAYSQVELDTNRYSVPVDYRNSPLVLQAYQRLSPLFEAMDAELEKLQLTQHGSWRVQLDSGAVIDLGHGSLDELDVRTRRFIATVTQVSSRFGRDLESADLRYPNGYAVKLRGVTTGASDDKVDKKEKR